ncbi:MAG TPA: HD-GYP domain-containing protein [Ardenticatenaceae bacterium]|nr:HD-GYP domain-containing protein [Ardenticatenaceae bacterium]
MPRLRALTPQPVVGVVVSALALLALAGTWLGTPAALPSLADPRVGLTALFLYAGIVVACCFPIHIRLHTKVFVAGVPLYLAVVLLPPHVAGVVVGAAFLTGELIQRPKTGNYPSDIATSVGRGVIVALAGGAIAHLRPTGGLAHADLLVATAIAMLAGELITSGLEIAPMSGEPPFRVIIAIAREAGLAAAIQNLLGMLGALAALHYPWALALLALPTAIVYLAFKRAKEMHQGTRQILESMADAVDLRDPYTGGHSRRVAALSEGTLRELQIMGPEAELIVAAARVHDIGKIGVPDEILKKPGRLTDDEWAIMNKHPILGAELLTRYPDFARGAGIVRHHHERWDGQGYPDGLKGHDIPFGARVIAVCDSFDAMTSDRPYRHGMSAFEATRILRGDSGKQWDPVIVEAFLKSIADQVEQPASAAVQFLPHPIAAT